MPENIYLKAKRIRFHKTLTPIAQVFLNQIPSAELRVRTYVYVTSEFYSKPNPISPLPLKHLILGDELGNIL